MWPFTRHPGCKKHLLNLLETINIAVKLDTYNIRVIFSVCELLAASMILGGNLCDKFARNIRPGDKTIELEDGTIIPILRHGPF